jgi:hypothetical protein
LLADAVSLPPDCLGSGPAQLENTMRPTITVARARLPAESSTPAAQVMARLDRCDRDVVIR